MDMACVTSIPRKGHFLCHDYSAMRMHDVELSAVPSEMLNPLKLSKDSICVLDIIAHSYS